MKTDDFWRPREFRAELTRLNAEDLSTSSDEELNGKSSLTAHLTDLSSSGKSLSRNGSKEENQLKRIKTPKLNDTSDSCSLSPKAVNLKESRYATKLQIYFPI